MRAGFTLWDRPTRRWGLPVNARRLLPAMAFLFLTACGKSGGTEPPPPQAAVNSLTPSTVTLVANGTQVKTVEAAYSPSNATCEQLTTTNSLLEGQQSCGNGHATITLKAMPGLAGAHKAQFCVTLGNKSCRDIEITVEAVRDVELEMPAEVRGTLNSSATIRPTLARNVDQCEVTMEGQPTGSYGNPEITSDGYDLISGEPGAFVHRFGSAVTRGTPNYVRWYTVICQSVQEGSKSDTARIRIIGDRPVVRIDQQNSIKEYCASNHSTLYKSLGLTFLTDNLQDNKGTMMSYSPDPAGAYRPPGRQTPSEIVILGSYNTPVDRVETARFTNQPGVWQDSIRVLFKVSC
jgi:hypothetical protein